MLHQRIKAIAKQLCANELSFDDWKKLDFNAWSTEHKHTLLNMISKRSHLSVDSLNDALSKSFDTFSECIKEAVNLKIRTFQTLKYCQTIQNTPLEVSTNEWLELASRFEEQNKKIVTSGFFLRGLGELKNTSYENLIQMMSVQRKQPERSTKRARVEEKDCTESNKKFKSRYYKEVEEYSPLIFEATETNHELQSKLKTMDVRCAILNAASPEKGFTNAMYTPEGKTKVKPLCEINGNRFFIPFSPTKLESTHLTEEEITKKLPKAVYQQAPMREYTVTLETITQCRGKPRSCSGKQLMGHSALEFMEAHQQKIEGKTHLAHIQAHCLDGPQSQDNLIPSSAAANYNTLELVERYIIDLIETDKTDSVHVRVTPQHVGNTVLSNVLTYSLKWTDKSTSKDHNETHYITPLSTSRVTYSMHKKIKFLRDEEIKEAADKDSLQKPGYK